MDEDCNKCCYITITQTHTLTCTIQFVFTLHLTSSRQCKHFDKIHNWERKLFCCSRYIEMLCIRTCAWYGWHVWGCAYYCLLLLPGAMVLTHNAAHTTCLFCNWRSLSVLFLLSRCAESGVSEWVSAEEWQHRINMTCGISVDVNMRHHISANVHSLTMCHKNWLFIKFMVCLLFEQRWQRCALFKRRRNDEPH